MTEGLGLALGVFLGNWLLVPLLTKNRLVPFLPERTFKRGFAIGVIAALLILVFYAVT